MGKGRYLFISEKGGLLPRWQEAFPDAIGLRLAEIGFSHASPSLIWLRLSPAYAVDDSLAEVRGKLGDVPCVILSDIPGDEEGLACFAAGARGYCNTHAAPEALKRVAKVIFQGGLWIGESLMQRIVSATSRLPVVTPDPADWTTKLTRREQTVAWAISSGASNKEIARQLNITERTVKAHVSAVLDKLQVRDRLQISLRIHDRRSG